MVDTDLSNNEGGGNKSQLHKQSFQLGHPTKQRPRHVSLFPSYLAFTSVHATPSYWWISGCCGLLLII